jgi:hypothetical protein
MQYNAAYINDQVTSNKIYTDTVKLENSHKLDTVPTVVHNTKDAFGSTKKTKHYILKPKFDTEIESLSRKLVCSILDDLPDAEYEAHVLTKRAEYWQPKDRKEDYDYFNAIRFSIVINHSTFKVWITPILTTIAE